MSQSEAPAAPRRYLLQLGLAFAILHVVYASAIPIFSGPDEQEHRQYVLALVEQRRLPILPELPQDVLGADGHRIAVSVEPTGLTGPATPQAQHPPVAYLVYGAIEILRRAMGLPDICLRLTGLLWGWITIAALAAVGRELFDDLPAVRDGLPATVLLPGPIYLCAVVSNDGAAMAAGAVVLWRLTRGFRQPYTRADVVYLGLALGLGLATKSTLLIYLPLAMVAVAAVRESGRPRWARALGVAALAVLPIAWWWLRNEQLYGTALVRAHARPTLFSIPHTIAASTDPSADLLVLTVELIYSVLAWLPTCLAPLWLLFNRSSLAIAVALVVWAVALACVIGFRSRQPDSVPSWRRLTERYCLAALGLMLLMYLQQFLYQDFQVSVFAGRYFLTVYGCLGLLLLSGWSAGLSDPHRPRLGHWVAVASVLLSLLCWKFAAAPPPPVSFGG